MSDRLADIKAREQAAFGGPWEALDADENGMHAVAVDGTVLVEVGDFCDAEFIAHARDDIPHLLALVESLTAERDALAAKVARVEALADAADDTDGEHSHRPYDGVDWDCGQCWVCEVRAAVAEPTGQDHRCSPYWSRSICGGCGGQEANCDKCGRLMCCEPTGQEGDQ